MEIGLLVGELGESTGKENWKEKEEELKVQG